MFYYADAFIKQSFNFSENREKIAKTTDEKRRLETESKELGPLKKKDYLPKSVIFYH